jgi:hypothetical protein
MRGDAFERHEQLADDIAPQAVSLIDDVGAAAFRTDGSRAAVSFDLANVRDGTGRCVQFFDCEGVSVFAGNQTRDRRFARSRLASNPVRPTGETASRTEKIELGKRLVLADDGGPIGGSMAFV